MGSIYLIRDDGKLVDMNEQAYDSEKVLQELSQSMQISLLAIR